MIKTATVIVLGLFLFLFSCSGSKQMKKTPRQETNTVPEVTSQPPPVKAEAGFLEKLLASDERMKPFLDHRDSLKIQVIYTQIDRDKNNVPSFTDYQFNVDPSHYFYPASTVKLPTALLALEKVNKLHLPGLDARSAMVTENGYGAMTAEFNDPGTPDGRPSISQYVKRVFLVSDNSAQNRMYEFLGQHYLNNALYAKGYKEAQIIHRLDVILSEDENRHTNPVHFYDSTGKMVYNQPMAFNQEPYLKRNDWLGTGYMKNGQLVGQPMDFSIKNRMALASLHSVLRSVMFPESVAKEQRFNIAHSDLNLVRKYMSMYPGESDYPFYDPLEYYPAYCKFLLYGMDKKAKILPQVRIFNKVGDAYGFLLDIAYVADFANKVEFMVSAVIYCNKDGIMGDDKYDYEEIGFPFMKFLGEDIYQYELNRPRAFKPDLSTFIFNYSSSAAK